MSDNLIVLILFVLIVPGTLLLKKLFDNHDREVNIREVNDTQESDVDVQKDKKQ